jgi:hypothetical protein
MSVREGGSYVVDNKGVPVLVERTAPAGTQQSQAVQPAEQPSEVTTNEDEE